MSRRRYTMLSKNHYMDLDKFGVVTKSERVNPNETYIPWYFWNSDKETKLAVGFEMKDGNLVNVYSESMLTDIVNLHGMMLRFVDKDNVSIRFYDMRKQRKHDIVITGTPIFTQTAKGGSLLDEYRYLISFDGISKDFTVDTRDKSAFKGVGYLANKSIDSTTKVNTVWLNYGLVMRPFKIEYLNRELEGSCYVFIYGLWAIILQDSLSFDALVLLKGINKDKIVIDKFIYTSNVYLIKILTLWKES